MTLSSRVLPFASGSFLAVGILLLAVSDTSAQLRDFRGRMPPNQPAGSFRTGGFTFSTQPQFFVQISSTQGAIFGGQGGGFQGGFGGGFGGGGKGGGFGGGLDGGGGFNGRYGI
jgi:hypothetical protein